MAFVAVCFCGYESIEYEDLEEAVLREGERCEWCGDELDFLPKEEEECTD
ncbi:hypothetical protein [Helicobacter brantae]|nr:hypothetical protein [Helicobacter brantae]